MFNHFTVAEVVGDLTLYHTKSSNRYDSSISAVVNSQAEGLERTDSNERASVK